ncbi:MAG: hypothetical protein Kow001_18950 [Acidobacteriota bacterium]
MTWKQIATLPASLGPVLLLTAALMGEQAPKTDGGPSKALEVVARAVEAMGGDAYRNMLRTSSSGNYFRFRKGQKAFARYQDWTVYQPAKWRFQLGEGKRQLVQIYNLELNKGWNLEGRSSVEAVTDEDLNEFRRAVRQDVDILLRFRLEEEGMNLYYYGPDEIAGQGDHEAVEFLDATNDAVIVFFDRSSGLPAKVETHFTDKMGIRHRQEQQFSNWHVIQGVNVPLNYEVYTDDELSSQRFASVFLVNPEIPDSYFLEPVIEDKDRKTKKK